MEPNSSQLQTHKCTEVNGFAPEKITNEIGALIYHSFEWSYKKMFFASAADSFGNYYELRSIALQI